MENKPPHNCMLLHREYEKLRKETENNAATATETRAEWKREAVEKAANKVAEASTTAKRFTAFFCFIASNLKLRK